MHREKYILVKKTSTKKPKRLTVNMDFLLHKAFKLKCIENNTLMSDVIHEFVVEYVKQ